MDFGVFAGVSLGYANHLPKDAGDDESGVGGFDAGINLGVRVNLAGHHGIELFSRIGVAEQKEEGKRDGQIAGEFEVLDFSIFSVSLRLIC